MGWKKIIVGTILAVVAVNSLLFIENKIGFGPFTSNLLASLYIGSLGLSSGAISLSMSARKTPLIGLSLLLFVMVTVSPLLLHYRIETLTLGIGIVIISMMIAGRLAKEFSKWKRYDEKRRGLMKEQLERILSEPDLSKNVYEVVSKSLK